MKLEDILKRPNTTRQRVRKTKRILNRFRRLDNPVETDIPSGWRADPHQGSAANSINWR